MARLRLSKSALAKQREQLKLYERLLPSLDLKRRQLSVEAEKARERRSRLAREIDELERVIGSELPMMAVPEIDLRGLIEIRGVSVRTENLVGVKLPELESLDCAVTPYSELARPAWIDLVVERMRESAEAHLRLSIADRRVEILDRAVRRVTQRVNLFERVLIPNAKTHIKKIQIFLGDVERDAVVRSKIAKSRRPSLLGEDEEGVPT